VSLEPTRIVTRHEETVVACCELARVGAEPVDEGNVRLRAVRQRAAVPPLLDPAIPRADVLADVAAVDLRAEVPAVWLGDGRGCLRPVGEAARSVERPGLVERAGWTCVDAESAVAAVQTERRCRLSLDVSDDCAEHDPGTVPPGDQQPVLAVDAHPPSIR